MPQFASPHISYDFLQIRRSTHPHQISPQSVKGWGMGPSKLTISPTFWHINAPHVSLKRFLPNFHLLWAPSGSFMCKNLGRFAQGISRVIRFKLRVHIISNFQCSLVAKLCVRGEHV